MEATYLDITGDAVPTNRRYTFEGITYTFRFKWNVRNGFFTVEIYDITDRVFLYSTKIVYGINLTESAYCPIKAKIIPLNIHELAGNITETIITKENFGKTIKLYTNIIS